MHDDDCHLPSLDWLTAKFESLPNTYGVQRSKPRTFCTIIHSKNASEPSTSSEQDYSSIPQKPPYSYSQLIIKAMQHFGGQKVLLTDIYNYIKKRYAWYRLCDPSWQNSIRHNLSLNKQFIKVPRSPGDKGKGSYWKLDLSLSNTAPPRIRKSSTREKKGEPKRKPKPSAEVPQVNPAILTFLKENCDTVNDPSRSSSSSRSSPQIMEIGVEDGRTKEQDPLSNDAPCDFPYFGDEISSEYDPSFQFASCFTDSDFGAEMALASENAFQEMDSLRTGNPATTFWSPLENSQLYSVSQTNDFRPSREVNFPLSPDPETHPWQDSKLSCTDDNLLFDMDL